MLALMFPWKAGAFHTFLHSLPVLPSSATLTCFSLEQLQAVLASLISGHSLDSLWPSAT